MLRINIPTCRNLFKSSIQLYVLNIATKKLTKETKKIR